jgi:hypothetical protein
MTAGVIIPFGMSAFMVLSKYISSPQPKTTPNTLGTGPFGDSYI